METIGNPVIAVADRPLSDCGRCVDAVDIEPSDHVLATAELREADNGVYRLTVLGTYVRADVELDALVYVVHGTCYAGQIFACITPEPIVVGTSGLTFTAIPHEVAEPHVVALECPTCGGPVHHWQTECDYCGAAVVVVGA